MPSLLVHWALAALIGVALLGDEFDKRALGVVLAVTALPDLDSVLGIVSTVGHREFGHTFVFPALLATALAVDVYVRSDSAVESRWGERGVRLAWVGVFCIAVAHIGLDFVEAGVNAFWPLHDGYYHLDGKVVLSSQRGLVQTFVELSQEVSVPESNSYGNASEVDVETAIEPVEGSADGGSDSGEGQRPVDRVVPIVRSGWELLVLVTGTVVTAVHLRGLDGE